MQTIEAPSPVNPRSHTRLQWVTRVYTLSFKPAPGIIPVLKANCPPDTSIEVREQRLTISTTTEENASRAETALGQLEARVMEAIRYQELYDLCDHADIPF
jgi:hypothetical protein